MSMPKGHKMSQGYATVADGLDYRTISEIMTSRGYKMNHATARNILLSAMRSLAADLACYRDENPDAKQIDQISKSPQFQAGIAEVISDLYSLGALKA
jgi:hypothetical protein